MTLTTQTRLTLVQTTLMLVGSWRLMRSVLVTFDGVGQSVEDDVSDVVVLE